MTVLTRLADLLVFLIGLMWLTGGRIWHVGNAQIETASLDLWVLAVVLLFYLARLASPQLTESGFGLFGRIWSMGERLLKNAKKSYQWGVIFLCFTFGLLFLAHCFKHWDLQTHGYDVSYVHQALYYPWPFQNRGLPLRANVFSLGSALEGHQTWSFFLLAPITSLFKYDELIFLIQILWVALPLFFFIKEGPLKLRKELFFFVAVVVLCQRSLRGAMIFDFREDAIAFAALLGMILALYKRHTFGYWLAFVIAILSKENVAAVTAFFAIPILFAPSLTYRANTRRLLALFTVLFSMGYLIFAFKWLIPHFAGAGQTGHPLFVRYGQYGQTTSEILWTLFTSPTLWWTNLQYFFEPSSLKYLLFLFGPFVFFFRTRESWVWLAPVIPGLVMNLMHSYRTQRLMIFHYELILLPFLIAALLWGAQSIRSSRSRVWLWGLVIALMFSDRWPGYYVQDYFPSQEHFRISQVLHRIPSQSEVWVDMHLSAQVNHVKNLRFTLYSELPSSMTGQETFYCLDRTDPVERAAADTLRARGLALWNTKESNSIWVLH